MRITEFGRRLDASVRRAGFAPLRLDLAQDVGFAASTIPPWHEPDPERRRLMTTTTRRNRRGRDMATLLSDFGHDLPTVPTLAREPKEPRLFRYAARRGAARPGRGWAAATAQRWRGG